MDTNRFRVLAVDDDPDVLEVMRMSLEKDFEVVAMTDPTQALDFLDYIQPDVAVLDIMMPKVTGYHIVEEMRSKPENARVQVIFLSAKNSPHDIRYGYKLGANYYLTKPFMPDRLKRTVDIVLGEAHVREPCPKACSLREIELRLHMKMPRVYESWESFQEAKKKVLGAEALRLRRPLAGRREKDDRGWEG